MRPQIALPAREVTNYEYPFAPKVQGQGTPYINALVRAGAAPIIVPLLKNEDALRQLYDQCSGLLLAGGDDMDPALYGAQRHPKTQEFSRVRDEQELKLLEWAIEDKKPVLGICRGMQMLNIFMGGNLYQDIPSEIADADVHDTSSEKIHESRIVHQLKLDPVSKLAKIFGSDKIGANAYHHQAIKNIGKGLKATAWAEDGIIEAIELEDADFVLGVQCHPESLEESVETKWRKLFNAFVEASKQQVQ